MCSHILHMFSYIHIPHIQEYISFSNIHKYTEVCEHIQTLYRLQGRPPARPHLMYVTPRPRAPASPYAPSPSSWLSERVLT